MKTCSFALTVFCYHGFKNHVASINKHCLWSFFFFLEDTSLQKKTDLLVDVEFLFVASRSAVETHSVHRNVGHLFWRNLHLQEAAAEKNNGWEQKRKKGGIYSVTIRPSDANAGGLQTNSREQPAPQIPQTQISHQKHEKHLSYTLMTKTHKSPTTTTAAAQTRTSNTAWNGATNRTGKNRRSDVNRRAIHSKVATYY